jgi:dolichol kinase
MFSTLGDKYVDTCILLKEKKFIQGAILFIVAGFLSFICFMVVIQFPK